jgi:serine/threonine-protein kinase
VVRTLAPLAIATFAATAHAETEGEKLRAEGRDLLERGQVTDACDKFELSLKREDNVDTLGLLASCHERSGKPGKAWNEFRRLEGRVPTGEKAAFVAEHLKALDSRVARARLDVGNRTLTDPRVDNEPVELVQGRIVSDPGDHTIRVEVGGKVLTRNARLKLGDNPDIVMTDEPLSPGPTTTPVTAPKPEAAPPESPPSDDGRSRRTLGYVVTGAGVVLLGVGTFAGIRTLSLKSDADNACNKDPNTGTCRGSSTDANDKQDSAKPWSWVSTIGLALGAVGVGAGIYLIATAGSGSSPVTVTTGGVRMTPTLGPGSVGLNGTW